MWKNMYAILMFCCQSVVVENDNKWNNNIINDDNISINSRMKPKTTTSFQHSQSNANFMKNYLSPYAVHSSCRYRTARAMLVIQCFFSFCCILSNKKCCCLPQNRPNLCRLYNWTKFYLSGDAGTKHHLRRNLCVRILEFERKKSREKSTNRMNVVIAEQQLNKKTINDKNKSYIQTIKREKCQNLMLSGFCFHSLFWFRVHADESIREWAVAERKNAMISIWQTGA